jgi:hypothetical protein
MKFKILKNNNSVGNTMIQLQNSNAACMQTLQQTSPGRPLSDYECSGAANPTNGTWKRIGSIEKRNC